MTWKFGFFSKGGWGSYGARNITPSSYYLIIIFLPLFHPGNFSLFLIPQIPLIFTQSLLPIPPLLLLKYPNFPHPLLLLPPLLPLPHPPFLPLFHPGNFSLFLIPQILLIFTQSLLPIPPLLLLKYPNFPHPLPLLLLPPLLPLLPLLPPISPLTSSCCLEIEPPFTNSCPGIFPCSKVPRLL